jgi:Putative lysophospholipase.
MTDFLKRVNLACEKILRTGFRVSMRLSKLTVFFLVCLWVAFQPKMVYWLCEFRPQKFPGGTYDLNTVSGTTAKDVFFKTPDGKQLHGWYFNVPDAPRTLLVHHGQGGNITSYIQAISVFVKSGCSVLVYDYEGFGRSEGTPSNPGVVKDGEAAYDYARKELGLTPNEIIHCGISLGTGVACQVATTRKSAAVVLLSPYTSLKNLAKELWPMLDYYPSAMFPPDLKTTEFVAKNKTVPLIIVHGAKDTMIPVHHSDELFAMANSPKHYLRYENGGHCDLPVRDAESLVKEFLKEL